MECCLASGCLLDHLENLPILGSGGESFLEVLLQVLQVPYVAHIAIYTHDY